MSDPFEELHKRAREAAIARWYKCVAPTPPQPEPEPCEQTVKVLLRALLDNLSPEQYRRLCGVGVQIELGGAKYAVVQLTAYKERQSAHDDLMRINVERRGIRI